jgi:hypothetical protein
VQDKERGKGKGERGKGKGERGKWKGERGKGKGERGKWRTYIAQPCTHAREMNDACSLASYAVRTTTSKRSRGRPSFVWMVRLLTQC